MECIASRLLSARTAKGEGFEMRLEIGRPEESEPDRWGCQVHITHLFEPPRLIYGADSWQALQLSFQFIANLLQGFVEDGGTLFWSGTSQPVVLEELFATAASRKGSS